MIHDDRRWSSASTNKWNLLRSSSVGPEVWMTWSISLDKEMDTTRSCGNSSRWTLPNPPTQNIFRQSQGRCITETVYISQEKNILKHSPTSNVHCYLGHLRISREPQPQISLHDLPCTLIFYVHISCCPWFEPVYPAYPNLMLILLTHGNTCQVACSNATQCRLPVVFICFSKHAEKRCAPLAEGSRTQQLCLAGECEGYERSLCLPLHQKDLLKEHVKNCLA